MSYIAIPVSDLPVAHEPIALLDLRPGIESLLRRRVEAMAMTDARLVRCTDMHPFAQAAHDAFYKHYPLAITPDDIWFCIVQGFAHHVNLHAVELRHSFVRHEGKEKLIVDRPDFILGQPNPWPEVFGAFSEQIAERVGRNLRDIVVADFSTTTEMHRAATEVALMDAFQAYFEYELLCGCGIPSIRLMGAPDDWRNIRARAMQLAQYGLQEWIDALVPILDQIEASSRGFSDPEFWKSLFRHKSWSLGSASTGWLLVLFPYLKGTGTDEGKLLPNPWIKTWKSDCKTFDEIVNQRPKIGLYFGPYLSQIPSGLSSAPVHVIDRVKGQEHDMRFVAGMFGVAQDSETKHLSASFGWAVVYDALLPVTPRYPTRSTRRRAAN